MAVLHSPLPPRRLRSAELPLGAAVGITFLAGAVGAGMDTAHGSPAKTLFALFLAAGAAVATKTVRRHRVPGAVVAVPLTYLLLLLLGGLGASGGYGFWFATSFIVNAPVVLLATAAAAVVAVGRLRGRR